MYEDICYSETFLKEVIIRIDFSTKLPMLAKDLPGDFSNAILSRFPIEEHKQALAQEFQFSAEEMRHSRSEFMEWTYFDNEKNNKFVISPECMFISCRRYTSYEDIRSLFCDLSVELVKKLKVLTKEDVKCKRFGMRYINQLEPESKKTPFDWSEWVSGGLLGLHEHFSESRSSLTRLFSVAEFSLDEYRLKFQFGLPNPDFPAIIKRPLYILDYDASRQGLFGAEEIAASMDDSHTIIQKYFESSITDGLRGHLGHAE